MTSSSVVSDFPAVAALLQEDLAGPAGPQIRDLRVSFGRSAPPTGAMFREFKNAIFQNHVLETLHLDGCKFDWSEDEAFVHPDDNPISRDNRQRTVHRHIFDHDVLNKEDVHDFFGAVLPYHPSIRKLIVGGEVDIFYIHVYTRTVETTTEAQTSALTSLEFNNVHVGTDKCHAVRRMLQRGVHLESLAFIDVTMDRESYAAVANVLRRDVVLKRLVIKDPHMSEADCRLICDCVTGNHHLGELSLNGGFNIQSGTFDGAVNPGCSVWRLTVTADCWETLEACRIFLQKLETNRTLQFTNVSTSGTGGPHQPDLSAELQQLKEANTTLRMVLLGFRGLKLQRIVRNIPLSAFLRSPSPTQRTGEIAAPVKRRRR
jgi:hypothetical protein